MRFEKDVPRGRKKCPRMVSRLLRIENSLPCFLENYVQSGACVHWTLRCGRPSCCKTGFAPRWRGRFRDVLCRLDRIIIPFGLCGPIPVTVPSLVSNSPELVRFDGGSVAVE